MVFNSSQGARSRSTSPPGAQITAFCFILAGEVLAELQEDTSNARQLSATTPVLKTVPCRAWLKAALCSLCTSTLLEGTTLQEICITLTGGGFCISGADVDAEPKHVTPGSGVQKAQSNAKPSRHDGVPSREQLVALAERSTLQALEGASEPSELQLLHVLTQAASGRCWPGVTHPLTPAAAAAAQTFARTC